MQDLSEGENILLGGIAALTEGILLQPTLYWKNCLQQGLPLSMSPRMIYRGTGAALCNEVAQMCLQFGATGAIKARLSGYSKAVADIGSAAAAGMLSAAVASPIELVMIQQQRVGGSLVGTPLRVLRENGAGSSGMLRGLGLAVMRDSIYVGGMLGLTPVMQAYLQESHGMQQSSASLSASALGGIAGGVLSHPFDVVKTCMQGDLAQTKFGSTSSTFRTLLAEGRGRFSNGMFWRTANITATVYIANECCLHLPKHIAACTRRSGGGADV